MINQAAAGFLNKALSSSVSFSPNSILRTYLSFKYISGTKYSLIFPYTASMGVVIVLVV